jgi:hypothetical protein
MIHIARRFVQNDGVAEADAMPCWYCALPPQTYPADRDGCVFYVPCF